MSRFKYLASISYDGSNYYGFTKSTGKITVQESIEETIKRICKKYDFIINLKCASRTDRGVHSLNQLITFFLPIDISDEILLKTINLKIFKSIRFKWIKHINIDYSLYDNIVNKEYLYLINFSEINPFLSKYIWFKNIKFDIEKFNENISIFEGKHDFGIFAKERKRYESTICNIDVIKTYYLPERNLFFIYLKGNRFLYNMIRRIVGSTVFITEKNLSTAIDFNDFLNKYINYSTFRAPPEGLYLLNVNLKEII